MRDVADFCSNAFGPDVTEISRSLSSGVLPVRAFVYSLLDETFSLQRKCFMLLHECTIRSLRIHFEDTDRRVGFLRQFVEALSGEGPISTFFAMAEALADAARRKKLIDFVRVHRDVVEKMMCQLFLVDDIAPFFASNLMLINNWRAVCQNQKDLAFDSFEFPHNVVDSIVRDACVIDLQQGRVEYFLFVCLYVCLN